jgi:hypothetical protein
MSEIAPDAPTAGIELVGSIATCASPAPIPHSKYTPRNFTRPNFSSMLSPKIHKNNMLPPRCIKPP